MTHRAGNEASLLHQPAAPIWCASQIFCTCERRSWCDAAHRRHSSHLQLCQQASARPKWNNFRKPTGGSNQLPLSPCQHRQLNSDLLILQPALKHKTVSEPRYSSRISKGGKKHKKISQFGPVLWVSGDCWNTKCPPDVSLSLWYIYGSFWKPSERKQCVKNIPFQQSLPLTWKKEI